MKKLLLVFLATLLLNACSKSDDISRHGFGNETPGNGNGNGSNDPGTGPGGGTSTPPAWWTTEEFEASDDTPRCKFAGMELRYGEPGILFTIDSEYYHATMTDIDNDITVRLEFKNMSLYLRGETIANNLHDFKTDSAKGITWYSGRHVDDNSPVYFIVEDLFKKTLK